MDDTLANDASAAVGVVQRSNGDVVVTAVGLTDIGRHRQVNQDSLGNLAGHYSDSHDALGLLYAIADGMGGHSRGEIASDLAIKHFFANYYASSPAQPAQAALAEALTRTNAAVHEAGKQVGGSNMGTTLTAALFRDNKLYIGNVGDSRTYRIRNGQIQQLTQDHSLIGEQLRSGLLNAAQARQSNIRNVITRAVGYRDQVVPDTFEYPLSTGEIILLCSDGLHGLVEDTEIADILTRQDLASAAKALIDLACERGAPDNVTALVIRVDHAPDEDRTIEVTAPNVVLPRLSDEETKPFPTFPPADDPRGPAGNEPRQAAVAGAPAGTASDVMAEGVAQPTVAPPPPAATRPGGTRGQPAAPAPAATTPVTSRQHGSPMMWFAGLGALILLAAGGGAFFLLGWGGRTSLVSSNATQPAGRLNGAEVGGTTTSVQRGVASTSVTSTSSLRLRGSVTITGAGPADITEIGLYRQLEDPTPIATSTLVRSGSGATYTFDMSVSTPLQAGTLYYFKVMGPGPGPMRSAAPPWTYPGGPVSAPIDLTVGK